jgi:hypothetical protein
MIDGFRYRSTHPANCRVNVSAHREAVAAALQGRQTSLKHFTAVRKIDKIWHDTYRCAPSCALVVQRCLLQIARASKSSCWQHVMRCLVVSIRSRAPLRKK